MLKLVLTVGVFILTGEIFVRGQDREYPYIKPCHKHDPNINKCLQRSANYLIAHLRRGIPELELTPPEPIIIDEIGLALGSGPDGYRATFRDIKAYGISNLTITAVRSDVPTCQFQLTFAVPKISARAQFQSSGILILVPASGGGDYWGEYGGARAKVYVKCNPVQKHGRTYLKLEQMKFDFSLKDIKMGVENVHNSNTIIQAALNLFINTNAHDIVKEMKPALIKKLVTLMQNFVQGLFDNIPYDQWIIGDDYN
ncbi:hypothetical protein MML48_3g00010780 [Holotrichia oblita]|uniref:Uncharacterized protein n=1 Tax=Holotrichia oblita TaxID=644536 RepID=A0ACB9TCA9_HOLOL|nr:hypothetical protein MML48_3g00010780 [Holotrichia oblita]